MKYIVSFFIVFCFGVGASIAQDDDYYKPTKADLKYYQSRIRTTVPPYGLDKVKRLIKTIKSVEIEEYDGGEKALKPEQYNSLSLREKFTYSMINPEAYSQNCDMYLFVPNEDKKIFGYLPNWGDESYWSKRQKDFLMQNRDSVMALIKESTLRSKKMGVNYKDALVEINAWEMIPFIIDYFKTNPSDKDALSVLFLLMREGKYAEFMKSISYEKLYGEDSYQYNSMIDYNDANKKLTFERAMRYYNEKLRSR